MNPVGNRCTSLEQQHKSADSLLSATQIYNGRKFSKAGDIGHFHNQNFVIWASKTAKAFDSEQTKVGHKKNTPEVAKKAGIQNEADQFFIDYNLCKLRDLKAGYLHDATENEVKSRLQALCKSSLLQEVDFSQNWSFFALTEVQGSEPKSQIKVQWLNNKQLHACTVDVWSEPPLCIAKFEDGKKETFTGIDTLIVALFRAKHITLDRMEKYLSEYSKIEIGQSDDSGYETEEQQQYVSEDEQKYVRRYQSDTLKPENIEKRANESSDTYKVTVLVPVVVERSYMTLRPNAKHPKGKKVYYNPRLVSLRRYFPPPHKLPLNCR